MNILIQIYSQFCTYTNNASWLKFLDSFEHSNLCYYLLDMFHINHVIIKTIKNKKVLDNSI